MLRVSVVVCVKLIGMYSKPEFVAARRAQLSCSFGSRLSVSPRSRLGVDLRAGQARQRAVPPLATRMSAVGNQKSAPRLDVELLAGGRVVERPRLVLRRRRRGEAEQRGVSTAQLYRR